MGRLIDGRWVSEDHNSRLTKGHFHRHETVFRSWITPDGGPGPTGAGGFAAEADRYHLYVSLACPWAHRTLIFRKLKGLEDLISVSIVDAMAPGETGWAFTGRAPATRDTVNGADFLWQIYVKADPDHTGRVTVPVLWDTNLGTIVSNESAEIIRMFNSAFDGLTGNRLDFYPEALRERIDEVNARVYADINNGVYRAGFAGTQEAYEAGVTALFAALDWAEGLLGQNRFLVGDTVTEADFRLATTLMRFDAVYFGHFKCNLRRIADYPNLSRFLKEVYHMPGIAETFDLSQAKQHYYWSHNSINPRRIVPVGPELEFLRS